MEIHVDQTEFSTSRLELNGLLAALRRLDLLLAQATVKAAAVYGEDAAVDPHRGLYINFDEVEQLLNRQPGAPLLWTGGDGHDQLGSAGIQPPQITRLQHTFGLLPFDIDLILIALAPEIDLRYERLYAYLQDDVTRKRPSIDLALNLLCADTATKLAQRARFASDAPLIRYGLLHLVPDPHQMQSSFLNHSLKLDEQISRFLLGQPGLDSRLVNCCELTHSDVDLDSLLLTPQIKQGLQTLAFAVQSSNQCLRLYFQGPPGNEQYLTAQALANTMNRSLLTFDVRSALTLKLEFKQLLQRLWHEARFQNAILYVDNLDVLRDSAHATSCRDFLAALASEQCVLSDLRDRPPLFLNPLSPDTTGPDHA